MAEKEARSKEGKERRKTITMVVLGDSGVGKTTAVCQYVLKHCDRCKLRPTIEDQYRKPLPDNVELDVIDTAGSEAMFSVMRPLYKSAAGGFIILYSVDSIDSWLRMVREFEDFRGCGKPIVVAGTFHSNSDGITGEKKISTQQLVNFGRKYSVSVFEIDLDSVDSVTVAFDALVLQMDRFRIDITPQPLPPAKEKDKRKRCCFSCSSCSFCCCFAF